MIKCKMLIDSGTWTEITFQECDTIEEVRTWLNETHMFISIGKYSVINKNRIVKVEMND